MAEYQKVRNSREISLDILDVLEQAWPDLYRETDRARKLREINDTLQGRRNQRPDDVLKELRACGHSKEVEMLDRDVQAFLTQKSLRRQPYMRASRYISPYKKYTSDPLNPIKVIDQALYDRMARGGFPFHFFQESYFDHVILYCMPDGEDCSNSVFRDCVFAACRIQGASFHDSSIWNSVFHSCVLEDVIFWKSSISHTRFTDCRLRSVSFQEAKLRACQTLDCSMSGIDFFQTVLDGSSYERIRADNIMYLEHATITQGGAAGQEAEQLRGAVLKALCTDRPAPKRRKRAAVPER